MDLVNWNKERKSGSDGQGTESHMPPTGFGGLSNRALARKPVIAAVNGYALGKETLLGLQCVTDGSKT